MGTRNRQRRAAKKRRNEPGRTGWRPGRAEGRQGGGDGGGLGLRTLLIGAAVLLRGRARCSDEPEVADLVSATADCDPQRVGAVLDDLFGEALGDAWEGGWQPAEVARVCRRRHSPRHGELVATAIAAAHSAGGERAARTVRAPAGWLAQLRAIGAADRWWGSSRDWLTPWARLAGMDWEDAIEVAVEAMSTVADLRVITTVGPPPSAWGKPGAAKGTPHGSDDAVLARVRALLAKAESTSFAAEADALAAKAQELMSRHSIDEAMAAAAAPQRERAGARRIAVDDPYAPAKSALVAVVADANGVRAVWDEDYAFMTIVGFEADLEAVDLLFTSLLMQAMLAKGRVTDHRGRSRTRSFRQSFYVAFAGRIGERLAMAAASARAGAERDLGSAVLPVLAQRGDEVGEHAERLFPRVRSMRGPSVTNADGWMAGRSAAELATLGPVQARLAGVAG